MSGVDLAVLVELARGRDVLEIGTWRGRSALEMARVARHVWVVDTFTGDQYTEAIYGEQLTLPDFVGNARERQLLHKLTVIASRWEDVLPLLDLSPFRFVFADADHSRDATKRLGRELLARLPDRVPVAFHDYGWIPECTAAVDDLAARFGRPVARVGDIIGILGSVTW